MKLYMPKLQRLKHEDRLWVRLTVLPLTHFHFQHARQEDRLSKSAVPLPGAIGPPLQFGPATPFNTGSVPAAGIVGS